MERKALYLNYLRMRIGSSSIIVKIILYIVLIVVVVALIFLPLKLDLLTTPEKVFIITFLVFSIVYSKPLAGYYFISSLLSLIDKGEDIYSHISKKLSKDDIYKFLIEGDLLILTENQLIKVQEITSLLFDMTLIFLGGVTILYLGDIIPVDILYSVYLAVGIIGLIMLFVSLYVNAKFTRVFREEFVRLNEVFSQINLQNQIDNYAENVEDKEDVGNKEGNKEENKENKESKEGKFTEGKK